MSLVVWLVCVSGLSHAHTTHQTFPASVRMAAPRSPNQPLRLQVDAFNKQHQLTLKPAPSPFAPNLKLHTTARDHQGHLLLQEVEVTDNDLHIIYHDPDTGAVVSVDGSSVEGLLTPTLSIKPSPDGSHQVLDHNLPDPSTDVIDYLEVPDHLHTINEAPLALRYPHSITAEVLVVVDSKLAAAIGTDDKVKNYLGIFFNSVNNRYLTMKDPAVKFEISGVIIIRKSSDEAYIVKSLEKYDYVNGTECIIRFAEWLYTNKEKLPQHDIATLLSGRDLANDENKNSLAGVAYRAGSCTIDSDNKMSLKAQVVEDYYAFYKGVKTAVHEMAHSLGAPHDGKHKTSMSCPWNDGYIMSYKTKTGTNNKFYFSKCSKETILNHISTGGACLWKKDGSVKVPISNKFPGEFFTIKQQCQRALQRDDAYPKGSLESMCKRLVCGYKWLYFVPYTQTLPYSAADGSICKTDGSAKCFKGECK